MPERSHQENNNKKGQLKGQGIFQEVTKLNSQISLQILDEFKSSEDHIE